MSNMTSRVRLWYVFYLFSPTRLINSITNWCQNYITDINMSNMSVNTALVTIAGLLSNHSLILKIPTGEFTKIVNPIIYISPALAPIQSDQHPLFAFNGELTNYIFSLRTTKTLLASASVSSKEATLLLFIHCLFLLSLCMFVLCWILKFSVLLALQSSCWEIESWLLNFHFIFASICLSVFVT